MSTHSRERGVIVTLLVVIVLLLFVPDLRSRTSRLLSGAGSQNATLGSPDFGVAGRVSVPLAPGRAGPIDVEFDNPGDDTLVVTELAVSIDSVVAPNATSDRRCTEADFVVEPGRLAEVIVAERSRVRLSDTDRPAPLWPRLRMVDTDVSQDGCRGATVQLDYHAKGRLES